MDMRALKIWMTAALLWALALGAAGQDPHFSLNQLVGTAVNPANTGLIGSGASHRLTLDYRSQWTNLWQRNTFQTAFVSYDTRLCQNPELGSFGFGLNLLHDASGSAPLQRNQVHLTASYTHLLDRGKRQDYYLSAGVVGGAIVQRIGNEERRYDEQFDGRNYDPTVPGEDFDRRQFTMGDLGLGLLFYSNGKTVTDNGFSIGGSYAHLNTPEYRFFDNDQDVETRLPRRLTLHASGSLQLSPRSAATAVRMLYMGQGTFRQLLLGADYRRHFDTKNGVSYSWAPGFAWRRSRYLDTRWHSDALVVSLNIHAPGLRLGFAYDLSLSSVRNVSNSGAFEVALQMQFEGKRNCPANCPWEW